MVAHAGDVALQHVFQVLMDYARRRPGLQASRWDGEEFLLI